MFSLVSRKFFAMRNIALYSVGVYRDGVYKTTPYNHWSLIYKLIPFNPFSLHLTLVDPVEQFAHSYDGFLQNLSRFSMNNTHLQSFFHACSVLLYWPRTATDMDGTLHTDLWKPETSREIKKIILASFEHLQKLYWFSKLGGWGSKIKPTMPILVLMYK